MTAQNPYPRVEALIETFGDWLKHRRELSEVRQLNTGDFDRIANDMGVSPGELDALIRRGPHAADQLPKMLEALGIDEADLARVEPLVLRDMERVCSLCGHKRQCDRDLAAGTSAAHYEGYCPNAPTIDSLDQRVNR